MVGKARRKKKSKKSLSLIEILTAALLLSLVVSGILHVFFTVRRSTQRVSQRLIAANLASSYLRSLLAEVAADNWDNAESPLHPGNEPLAFEVGEVIYPALRDVVDESDLGYRKVTITVELPGQL